MTTQDTTQAGGWVNRAMELHEEAMRLNYSAGMDAATWDRQSSARDKESDADAETKELRAHLTEQSAAAERMREALDGLIGPKDDPSAGWRGHTGASELFACEYCRVEHEDCAEILHAATCPITLGRAALSAYNQLKKG